MPKNVRNFWIETEVDGLARKMESGPQNKEGGFTTKVLVREDGSISDSYLMITGEATEEGDLFLTVAMHRKSGSVTRMQLITNRDKPVTSTPTPQRPDAFWKEVTE